MLGPLFLRIPENATESFGTFLGRAANRWNATPWRGSQRCGFRSFRGCGGWPRWPFACPGLSIFIVAGVTF